VAQSVSQPLSFARKEEYHLSEHDVTELVRTTVQRFSTQLRETGISVRLQESIPVRAAVDEDKLRRTLLNLLENAVDAVQVDGLMTVSVSTVGRSGPAEEDQGALRRHSGGDDDRLRLREDRRGSDEGRRVRLPRQAV